MNIRKRLKNTFIADIYRFFRYSLNDIIVNRVYRTVKRGHYKKAISYPFKLIYTKISGKPKTVVIDLVSVCNIRCPMCSVPPDIASDFTNKKHIDLELFKEIIDGLDGYVTDLSLVYSGEPLLHPQFADIVDYVKDKYYILTISNGTVIKGKRLATLCNGVDYLQFSFDGNSKESYEKYRVGAKFEEVRKNINTVIKEKKKIGTGLPVITITYLVNSYNESEVEDSRKYWIGKGVNNFFEKAINLNLHRRSDDKDEEDLKHWLPSDKEINLYDNISESGDIKLKKQLKPCEIVKSPVIRGDGEILMCCHDLNNSVKIGNIQNIGFKEKWESESYVKIRRNGSKRKYPICQVCGK